ncbi:MAG: N,N-dimethylformamidase beta subunit family domain-containing protein [Terriglobales bacterium]
MVDLLAWAVLLGGAIGVVAGVQYLQCFVLQRWRVRVVLPDPVAFCDAPSFRRDKEIVLRIHSSQPVTVCFSRCVATGFELVHQVETPASRQSRIMHRWSGFNWTPSIVLAPKSLQPGFYRIDLEHRSSPRRKWCTALVVRDDIPQPVTVVASTNTWNAYNDFGGLSNYRDRATPQPLKAIRAVMMYCNVRIRIGERHSFLAVPLPERRPNACLHRDLVDDTNSPSHLARAEAALIRFLERERIPYAVVSDRDFAYDLPAAGIQLIIFNTHPEYWSEEMMGRLEEFTQRGISVAFLSGNNMYRRVQFMDRAICAIEGVTPPERIAQMTGTCYDPHGYLTYGAYQTLDATHWCFEGLGVRDGSGFGEGNAKRPAASGYETDKLRAGNSGVRVLAVGKNWEGPAFMVCRDLNDGGFVFAAGSVSFTPCLEDDSVIQGLVLNLVRRALAGS